jgi:hypothetical protein
MPNRLIIFALLLVLSKASGQAAGVTVIEGVNVIPMTEEVVVPNQRVLLAGGKILRIEPASTPLREHPVLTIDGRGKYLLPGLSEMHYHFRSKDIGSDFKLLVANGITTVRNMSEDEGQDQIAIRQQASSGALLPLNYFTTGPYLRAKDLQTAADVAAVVKRHKERGYDFLKIADNLPASMYLQLLAACQANSIPVVGHAQRALPMEYSTRMKSIEHVEEFAYLAKGDGSVGYVKQDAAALQALAAQLKASGVYIGTTLVGFEFITNCLDDKRFAALQHSELTKYLSPEGRAGFLTENNDYRKLRQREFDGQPALVFFDKSFAWMQGFTRVLAANQVPLLTGSDTYGMVIVGFSLHREFELLQQLGLKPYDILLASTVNPARYLNAYSQAGTVSAGKNADLVLLDKNPLTDIGHTKSIAGVLVKGRWFARPALDAMLKEVEQAYK